MNTRKILVVDDEVDLVETVRFPLEMEGFNVLVSYNGEDALNQASAFACERDVILESSLRDAQSARA